MKKNVFTNLKIDSTDILEAANSRSPCPKCGRSRKYFCYTCFVAVGLLQNRIPSVKLPVKIDIIKHRSERDGKSTACHAAVLANDDVTIYTYPCIPDYNKNKVILVFPGDGAVPLENLVQKETAVQNTESVTENEANGDNSEEKEQQFLSDEEKDNQIICSTVKTSECRTDNCISPQFLSCRKRKHEVKDVNSSSHTEKGCVSNDSSFCQNVENFETGVKKSKTKPTPSFSKVVFIDSTWKQAKTIFEDERLSGLQRVEIKCQRTCFWRSQEKQPDTYLSTIEAVYYFLCSYHELYLEETYNGCYDNLLFFFSYMCEKITFSNEREKFK